MHTPIHQSRKFSTFGSSTRKLADSFLQTELKRKRSSNDPGVGADDEGRTTPLLMAEPSDIDGQNQIEMSSAKKSSGLKCIAK